MSGSTAPLSYLGMNSPFYSPAMTCAEILNGLYRRTITKEAAREALCTALNIDLATLEQFATELIDLENQEKNMDTSTAFIKGKIEEMSERVSRLKKNNLALEQQRSEMLEKLQKIPRDSLSDFEKIEAKLSEGGNLTQEIDRYEATMPEKIEILQKALADLERKKGAINAMVERAEDRFFSRLGATEQQGHVISIIQIIF